MDGSPVVSLVKKNVEKVVRVARGSSDRRPEVQKKTQIVKKTVPEKTNVSYLLKFEKKIPIPMNQTGKKTNLTSLPRVSSPIVNSVFGDKRTKMVSKFMPEV